MVNCGARCRDSVKMVGAVVCRASDRTPACVRRATLIFSVRFSFLSSKPTQFSPTISIIRILSCDHYYQCDLLLDYHLGQINLLYFITTIIILDHRHRSLHHHHHHHPHRASLAVISQSCLVVRFLRYEIEKDCSDLVVIQC